MRGLPWIVGSVALISMASTVRAEVTTVEELVAAVTGGNAGDTVVIGPGTYELTESLRPQPGMTIRGAGTGLTVVRNAATWAPGTQGLTADEGATRSGVDCTKYLFNLGSGTTNVVISDMTLTGPSLHGGICGFGPNGLELMRLEFRNFLWAGVRTFIMDGASIHDNVFFDSSGRANVTSGWSGGALFLTYTKNTEIVDNRISRSSGNGGYGIKGREARNVRIYRNTIEANFAIELPFENDYYVEIDQNYLGGTISIPKWAGGGYPDGGYTFHVHHNYFNTSYSFEYHRNAIEIDHNLFDFSLEGDYGNLISGFDTSSARGGTRMHNNLIRNPGRGIYWNEGVYNYFAFYNNHVRGETTVTPRKEGLFAFRPARDGGATDWSTIVIRDNIIELAGTDRPLMRNPDSHAAVIENNTLTGISDTASYANQDTGAHRGPLEPLCMRLGAYQEWTVDGWQLSRTPNPIPADACGVTVDAGVGDADGGATDGSSQGMDAASARDAGPRVDAAMGRDAGASDAAGQRGDAAVGRDAGSTDATHQGMDASAPRDGGTTDGAGPGLDAAGGNTDAMGLGSDGAQLSSADASVDEQGTTGGKSCTCVSSDSGQHEDMGHGGWLVLLVLTWRRRRSRCTGRC